MRRQIYDAYVHILKAELVLALGCTEPIAIALAGAKMRETLGALPDSITVQCSGNFIKNAKSVVVPGSGGMKGIEAAALLGAVCGDASKDLEVLTGAKEADIRQTRALLQKNICSVKLLESKDKLHIIVRGVLGERFAEVEIQHVHNGITRVETEKGVQARGGVKQIEEVSPEETALLSAEGICEFADCVCLDDVRRLLSDQIKYNTAIAEEGLRKRYGLAVGRMLLDVCGKNVETRARAAAAAASDARMSGCELPVVINAGSGNQGITVSLPVHVYAQTLGASEEKLYRALTISNLMSIYQKSAIGRLSAFCGAVTAAAGAGAGITYLHGGTHEQICNTVCNTLASVSGMLCDGAKASCAAKISAAVDAAILGFKLSMAGCRFADGDGLMKRDADRTIQGIGRVAREGMELADRVILETMLQED
ncbi:MAG: L-serine ammonia-lyase, iron-sulfur-dependent, subunit alpha [Oscillospiraceae bacterium]|nr:L-serine ammonia-lyase, iron-sulfur-dependent, subunit alpha [Oscillospiraceae bacterium]